MSSIKVAFGHTRVVQKSISVSFSYFVMLNLSKQFVSVKLFSCAERNAVEETVVEMLSTDNDCEKRFGLIES